MRRPNFEMAEIKQKIQLCPHSAQRERRRNAAVELKFRPPTPRGTTYEARKWRCCRVGHRNCAHPIQSIMTAASDCNDTEMNKPELTLAPAPAVRVRPCHPDPRTHHRTRKASMKIANHDVVPRSAPASSSEFSLSKA